MRIFYFIISLLFTILILGGTTGCSKKRGCADVNACNFDPSAGKNDGSCTYEVAWYLDKDGDGYGDPSQFVVQCEQPDGYVNNANGSMGVPATDFTSTDCDGLTHHLYTELESGKIVVLVWVMPCSSCITDAIDAMNIVNSYATTHPGRVVLYLVDDYANNSCQDLSVWCSWYGISSSANFSDPVIKMSDYGLDGMPKIVAIGGANHQVYYNQIETTVGLDTAIDQALIDNP